MKAILQQVSETSPSDFLNLSGIEYFRFEEDFMEHKIRCVPMIIRFKMDKVGIKLKLSDWGRFSREEKIELAIINCNSHEEITHYYRYLTDLVKKYTGKDPKVLKADKMPSWDNHYSVPETLIAKLKEFDWHLSIEEWKGLTDLQRFALLKLCRPGHRNRNFPKAIKEFGLIN